jgi:hypothetical protein
VALWICEGCTTRYAVGAPCCPQCSGTEYVEEGAAEMAKITVHGGPSIAGEEPEGVAEADVSEEPEGESGSEAAAEESEKAAPRRRARGK